VVGSQINTEEQIFGAFDGRIMRRFWSFISPYRRRLVLSLLAVLVFAASQIAIPLILRLVGCGRPPRCWPAGRWPTTRSTGWRWPPARRW
jgi:ABC-type multidrug transport system fused ATPase/permease subunit